MEDLEAQSCSLHYQEIRVQSTSRGTIEHPDIQPNQHHIMQLDKDHI